MGKKDCSATTPPVDRLRAKRITSQAAGTPQSNLPTGIVGIGAPTGAETSHPQRCEVEYTVPEKGVSWRSLKGGRGISGGMSLGSYRPRFSSKTACQLCTIHPDSYGHTCASVMLLPPDLSSFEEGRRCNPNCCQQHSICECLLTNSNIRWPINPPQSHDTPK